MVKNFRTYDTSIRFYRLCEQLKLPRHLRDQLSRSSSSIALNLSEGSARSTLRDRRRFYTIALGSLRESKTILDLAGIAQESEIQKIADILGAQLYRLIQNLLPTLQETADRSDS